MSELADLLVAIGTAVGSIGGTFVLVWERIVKPRQEKQNAASRASSSTAETLLAAVEDGELTPDEVAEFRRTLHEGGQP